MYNEYFVQFVQLAVTVYVPRMSTDIKIPPCAHCAQGGITLSLSVPAVDEVEDSEEDEEKDKRRTPFVELRHIPLRGLLDDAVLVFGDDDGVHIG